MPDKETIKRARQDAAEGKSPSTQAGEFIRDEIREIRGRKHGARSTKQAIAIGLSEARRAGVKLPPPKGRGNVTRKAKQDLAAGKRRRRPDPEGSRAASEALKKEGHNAASTAALSRHAKGAARQRSAADRSRSAKKAATTRKRTPR